MWGEQNQSLEKNSGKKHSRELLMIQQRLQQLLHIIFNVLFIAFSKFSQRAVGRKCSLTTGEEFDLDPVSLEATAVIVFVFWICILRDVCVCVCLSLSVKMPDVK
jgi:hypothetical protein